MSPDEPQDTAAAALRVAVAVPTFRRNDYLVELLPLLISQADDVEGSLEHVDVDIVIVDNDPDGGAADVVDRPGWGDRVRYVHEPVAGLAAARNRALDAAEDSRLLAFIDDDGHPEPGWLVNLVGAWLANDCAAVAGRVLERFEVAPPEWISVSGLFHRPSFPTGTEMPAAASGNLLLDLDVLRSEGLRFDRRFGLTGGEDTLLTTRLAAGGHRIVWCDEARITDLVPADRLTRSWVTQRAWSHGNTEALIWQVMATSPAERLKARAKGVVGGAARASAGSLRYVLGRVFGRLADQGRGLWVASRGAGMVAGSIGKVYEEYSR